MDTRNLLARFACAITLLCLGLQADDTQAWNNGQSFGATVKSYYGGNMQGELFTPMTSDTNFKTMDGKKSFKANMTCGESSKSFMTVSYSLGSPKNGATPIIKMDKDLDGTKEYTFTSPYTASAICSNGIAVCPNGNFDAGNACSYYKWSYNGNSISLISSTASAMSSCTCINDSCGSIAVSSKDSVSNKIASGVYGVISAYSATFIVSQISTIDGVVEYFGQRTDSCSNYKGTVATTGTSSSLDSSSAVLSQSDDNTSSYSALLGGSANYSKNSPTVTSQVSSTTIASKSVLTSVNNTDGTTDFSTNSSNGTLNGHVGIPLSNGTEKYCQVTWLGTSNEVFTDGTERSTSTTSGEQWQLETRLCVNDVCPFQASKGESVKYDCGKIDNFSAATSAMSAVQELADDITCGSL